jgi:hypothetical protein
MDLETIACQFDKEQVIYISSKYLPTNYIINHRQKYSKFIVDNPGRNHLMK